MTTADTASDALVNLDETGLAEQLPADALARDIASALALKPAQVLHTLELVDGGNTVPFIARYRKERTENLDEVQIQAVADSAASRRALHTRKRDVLRLIAEQGRLTRGLADLILAAATLQAVEDLYLPYRPKRKTRASVARERGLQPLADLILTQSRAQRDALAAAEPFVNLELGVDSAEAALAGACDICAPCAAPSERCSGEKAVCVLG